VSPFPTLTHEPVSSLEWEVLARNAAGLLMIDSLRTLGLIEGGPGIDRDECELVLQAAAEHGYTASLATAVDAAIAMRDGWHEEASNAA
jgi:hypothetical protein